RQHHEAKCVTQPAYWAVHYMAGCVGNARSKIRVHHYVDLYRCIPHDRGAHQVRNIPETWMRQIEARTKHESPANQAGYLPEQLPCAAHDNSVGHSFNRTEAKSRAGHKPDHPPEADRADIEERRGKGRNAKLIARIQNAHSLCSQRH